MLPAKLTRELNVLPFHVAAGRLHVASMDTPSDALQSTIRDHTTLEVRFHLVTPTQFAALAKLDDLGAVSQNQLGRLTAMDPATISGVIGRLTARGYVRQSPDPKDARVVILGLTAAGKSAIASMKAVAANVSAKTLEPLTPGEAAALVAALAKIG